MIGNEEQRKEIEKALKEIAKQNKTKYKQILDNTDCGDTEIVLGWYKNDYDDKEKQRMSFDIIYGHFIDTDGDYSSYMWGYYFELSDTFEEDMQNKINEIIEKDTNALKEGEKTIERLQKLVSE